VQLLPLGRVRLGMFFHADHVAGPQLRGTSGFRPWWENCGPSIRQIGAGRGFMHANTGPRRAAETQGGRRGRGRTGWATLTCATQPVAQETICSRCKGGRLNWSTMTKIAGAIVFAERFRQGADADFRCVHAPAAFIASDYSRGRDSRRGCAHVRVRGAGRKRQRHGRFSVPVKEPHQMCAPRTVDFASKLRPETRMSYRPEPPIMPNLPAMKMRLSVLHPSLCGPCVRGGATVQRGGGGQSGRFFFFFFSFFFLSFFLGGR